MSDQQPDTTGLDTLGIGPPPSGTASTTTGTYRAPIGVGYQTNESGQDVWYFPSTGQTQAADPNAEVPDGAKVVHPGQVFTDDSGQPVPYNAPLHPDLGQVVRGAAGIGPPAKTSQVAQYRDGDQYKLWGQIPPELQPQLWQAFIDKGLVAPGRMSLNDAISAMTQVMGYANASGQDWKAALRNLPSQPLKDDTPPKQITLSSPADLRAVFKDSAARLLGNPNLVPEDEIDRWITSYQNTEKADAEAAISAQARAASGTPDTAVPMEAPPGVDLTNAAVASPQSTYTTTQTVSPQTSAEEAIKRTHAGAYGATQIASAYDKFLSIVAGGVGNPGSTAGSA